MGEDGSGTAEDRFEWESLPPEPGESHGLPDWYPQVADDSARPLVPLEPVIQPQPWWSKSISLKGSWHVLVLIALIALGLSKVVALLVIAHIDLAAAHAGVATDVLAYGGVLLFSGFAMRWTSRWFGLGQALRPDLYDEIGLWLLRLGTALGCIGSLAVMAAEYL
ncbi:MAG TPA: hypothetical protein VG435_13185 [Acidimicrobiales bacterium]|nr:hypothetical protein [Acidimicrobiales bacterium]